MEDNLIVINLIYQRSIIAEVVFECGKKPVNFYGNRFLNELIIYGKTGAQFRKLIIEYLNRLS